MFVSTRTAEAADDIQAILDRFVQHVYSVHRFVMYCVNSDMFVSPVYKTRPDPRYYYYFFDPGTEFPGNEKITLRNTIEVQQEAPLSPRDSAMRLVGSNLANYHATVQKLLIRQVLIKPMV